MENQWAIPLTDGQGHHVIPPTPEYPGPAFQQNMPTYQRNEYPTFQNCHCAQCSAIWRTQVEPPTWYPVQQQDPRYSGSAGTPFLNHGQAFDNPAETAVIVPSRSEAQLAPPVPQTSGIPDNFNYDPANERAGPSNVDLLWAPTLNVPIREGRRRLAGRYLNNPDAFVSMIRLEPSASGQLQVVIILEMVNLL